MKYIITDWLKMAAAADSMDNAPITDYCTMVLRMAENN